MNEAELRDFLANSRRIVHKFDQWADDKKASGAPLSLKERRYLRKIRALLAQLKQRLLELKREPY